MSRLRYGRAVVLALCVLIAAADAGTIRAYYDHGRPEWNRVANLVASSTRKDERVFAGNGWTELNFGYYWRKAGSPVPLERLPPEVPVTLNGPAWIVTASCVMDPFTRETLLTLPLRISLPYTNHSEVRYLPKGKTIVLPRSVCTNL